MRFINKILRRLVKSLYENELDMLILKHEEDIEAEREKYDDLKSQFSKRISTAESRIKSHIGDHCSVNLKEFEVSNCNGITIALVRPSKPIRFEDKHTLRHSSKTIFMEHVFGLSFIYEEERAAAERDLEIAVRVAREISSQVYDLILKETKWRLDNI